MPETYNLYPELKRICEDKRIRCLGVWDEDYQDYLRSESFALDMRGYTKKEWSDVKATYLDLELLKINNPPCEKMILHAIVKDENGVQRIISFFLLGSNKFDQIFENKELFDEHTDRRENEKGYDSRFLNYAAITYERFIVLLATRGIEKHHTPLSSRKRSLLRGEIHKKGTGGYTIIQRPGISTDGQGNVPPLYKVRPHFRRGHIRKFHSEDKTKWVWVSPCFINGEPEVQRKAYLVA